MKAQPSRGASPLMAAPPPLTLKRSYRSVSSLQQFYSGGPFAVSSDGASLACACGDEIKIVNTSDASVLASLDGDSESVTAFAFSPDGCFLFSAGHSRLVRVWDLSSRKCVRSWKILLSAGRDKQQSSDVTLVSNEDDMRRGFLSAVVLPSDLGLLCVTADQQFLFYCPMKSAEGMFQLNLYKRLVGYNEEILDMKFLGDDEQYVAVATNLEQVRLWDVASRHCIGIGRGHMGAVGAVAFSKKSKNFLVSGSSFEGVSEDGDQEIALKAKAVVAAHDKDINSLAVSPNDSGDGLIKLWTIKTSECIATYDQHEGKIWALAVGKKTEMLVTGGTDALINFWHDSTAADKQEAFLREVSNNQCTSFCLLSFLYTIVVLCRRRDVEDPIEKALGGLGKEEIHVLLEYVREWNTKPKLCHVAQAVLFRMFRIFPPTDIVEVTPCPQNWLQDLKLQPWCLHFLFLFQVKGVSELLEGLIPYSQRHFSRIDRFVRSIFLLDYVLARMSVVDPEETILPRNGERPLASENGVADEQDASQSNIQVDDISCKDDTGKSSTCTEMDGMTSLKKRKSSKSKKGSAKKINPEEKILPSNGEQHPLASENGVADEQDASQSNIQVDDISCKDDIGKSSTCDEMDGMTSLKKRKSSKSKKGSAKKVKLTKHKNNSTISVEA
ncbi:hypothetical protein B296_00018043 [Ensete ventricosum]|uniref:U3 small nucleolar RNA-associated protein 13 C-terminal domain-containing protein n=1 Tax=Ensete ventricosum TaxID=4639 RepID=A0A427AHW8_ENSVE|nr:hypothetical protein B296_00018043 [Ensete ventricosum]